MGEVWDNGEVFQLTFNDEIINANDNGVLHVAFLIRQMLF